MTNVAEKIAARLVSGDPLVKVLAQTSRAYGSVAGALENFAGFVARGQDSDAAGRQAFAALVDAIHAPRAEAQRVADELTRLTRNVISAEVQP